MVLAAFLFMRRMAEVTNVSAVTRELERPSDERATRPERASSRRAFPTGVEVYEINGPFFFGAAETFKDTLARVGAQAEGADHPHAPRARARLHRACTRCSDVVRRTRGDGTLVLLADVHAQPLVALDRSAGARRRSARTTCSATSTTRSTAPAPSRPLARGAALRRASHGGARTVGATSRSEARACLEADRARGDPEERYHFLTRPVRVTPRLFRLPLGCVGFRLAIVVGLLCRNRVRVILHETHHC